MTEPIAVDAPPKSSAAVAPRPLAGVAAIPATARSESRSVAKSAESPKPSAPAGAGLPSRLPGFFQRLTRKHAAIGASAIFSLAAGIAGLRLISPDDAETPTASRTLVPETKPPSKAPTIEEARPGAETIPPAGLPIGPGDHVPVVAGDPIAPSPFPPGAPSAGTGGGPVTGQEPLPPARPHIKPHPTAVMAEPPANPLIPSATPPANDKTKQNPLPDPEPLGGGVVIPVAGGQPPKTDPKSDPQPLPVPPLPDPAGVVLPKIDPKPDAGLPGTLKIDPTPLPKVEPVPKTDPKMDTLPIPKVDPLGTPAIKPPDPPPAVAPAKEPDKKIVGLPPIPMTGGDPMMVPIAPPPTPGGTAGMGNTGMAPPDLGMLPAAPAKLPAGGGGDNGTRMEFTKPSGTPAVTPIGATSDRAPTTTYDVDIYSPRQGDTWEAISREFFGDARFAAGLRAYNRNRPLAGNSPVDVPPLSVVKRYMSPAPGAPGTGSGGFGSGGDWGAVTPPARATGEKIFRVPMGGMTMVAIARMTLGSEQRFDDIYRLNPHLKPDDRLPAGTEVKLPPDARNP